MLILSTYRPESNGRAMLIIALIWSYLRNYSIFFRVRFCCTCIRVYVRNKPCIVKKSNIFLLKGFQCNRQLVKVHNLWTFKTLIPSVIELYFCFSLFSPSPSWSYSDDPTRYVAQQSFLIFPVGLHLAKEPSSSCSEIRTPLEISSA